MQAAILLEERENTVCKNNIDIDLHSAAII